MAGEVTVAVSRVRTRGCLYSAYNDDYCKSLLKNSGLVLSLNKEVLMRTHISGSSGAIEKLMSCQEHLIIASKNQGIEATRLVSETQAREKKSREQAEREGVASEQRDAIEQEKEPDKAAQQPAPSLSDNRVATLPAPVDQPPADPGLKGGALVRAIKQELKRVGCYDGRLDEDWQTAPARASIQKFARLARLTISPVESCSMRLEPGPNASVPLSADAAKLRRMAVA